MGDRLRYMFTKSVKREPEPNTPEPIDPRDDSKWDPNSPGKRLLDHSRSPYDPNDYDPKSGTYRDYRSGNYDSRNGQYNG